MCPNSLGLVEILFPLKGYLQLSRCLILVCPRLPVVEGREWDMRMFGSYTRPLREGI